MKAKDIIDLTDEELDQRYRDSRKELFNLRMQQSTGQLDNPMRLRLVRRDIARIKTIMTDRRRTAE